VVLKVGGVDGANRYSRDMNILILGARCFCVRAGLDRREALLVGNLLYVDRKGGNISPY
jgi:hypothetical protein